MNPLTLNDFADIYDCHHQGRRARTLPMEVIFDWVSKSPYVIYDDKKDEFYRKEKP